MYMYSMRYIIERKNNKNSDLSAIFKLKEYCTLSCGHCPICFFSNKVHSRLYIFLMDYWILWKSQYNTTYRNKKNTNSPMVQYLHQ